MARHRLAANFAIPPQRLERGESVGLWRRLAATGRTGERCPVPRRKKPTAWPGTPGLSQPAPSTAVTGPVVVGLGASAGGLEALEKLLDHAPAESGLAFVVVQHLERHHPSMLVELLSRHTRMTVLQAEDRAPLAPDHVHVIAPGTLLTIDQGRLRVVPLAEAGAQAPVDALFRSLAKERGESAVAIILSGSGRDGTAGLRAIKERGGFALAQSPETAKYDSMPRSAIGAGLVDEVLPVEAMPARVLEHARHIADAHRPGRAAPNEELISTDEELHPANEELETVNTELQQMVDELGTAADDLANLFASTEIATIFLDRELRIVKYTPATSDLLHLVAADVGRPLVDFSPRFEGQDLVADAREVLRTLTPVERQIRSVDGQSWFNLRVLPYRTVENVAGVVFTFVDISHLKRSEESLRESEERFRLLVENVRDHAIFMLAPDGTVASWNVGAARLKGYRAEEIVGQHFSRFYPEEDLRAGKPQRELEVAAAEGRVEQEGWRLRKDGSRFWANVVISAVRDEAGRLRGFAKVTRDFTERKRAEEAVRTERDFTTAVIDTAGALVVVLDREGHITRFNRACEEVTGYSAAEAKGRTFWDLGLIPPEQLAGVRGAWDALVRGEVPGSYENHWVAKDGSRRLIAWSNTAITGAGGVPEFIVGTGVDITERKQAEEALRESEERLKRAQGIAHLGSWELDLLSNKLTWSDEVYRILGLPPQDLVATYEGFLDAVHPDDRAAVDAAYSGSLREGKDSYQIEHRVVRKGSGEVRVVQERCEHIRDGSGRIVRSVGMVHDVTERRQAELESEQLLGQVQRRAAELDATIESLADGLVAFGADGRVSRVNANAERILGVSKEYFDKSIAAMIEASRSRTASGAPLEERRTAAMRALRGETVRGETRRIRRGDGKDIWVSTSAAPVLVEGEIAGAVATFADVTDRVQAEEELRRASAFDEAAMRSLGEGLYTIDGSGLVTSMNPAAEELFGWTFAELRGRKMHDVTHHHYPDGRLFPSSECAGFQVLTHGRPLKNHEDLFIRKDGTFFDVTYSTAPLRDAGGAITGLVVVFGDIGERKRAEEDVKRSREGLKQLAEASLRVMRETDLEAMFQAVSAAALELTRARIVVSGHGYVSGQFVIGGAARAPGMPSCPPVKMFPIEKGGVYGELVEGTAETIRLTDAEMRAHPRWWGLPEEHVPLRGLLGARLVDRQGRSSGMILVTDKEHGDFTAEDESLLRQLATLASLAAQHVEARICLEEADRSKNQFLAMLSHELRNPLAPIRNSLYILDRSAPGGEQARRAQTVIDRQVNHLTRLVDDLLDVTRISRGKVQLQRERLDVGDVARRAVEDHRSSFTKGRLELQVTIPDAPVWIDGDRTRVAQVIGNLLQNSAKFTEPGGRVVVSLEGNLGLQEAIIRVRDTGAGIAPEMLPRIFQPFTQADTTLDRSKGGLGLGLALVKGLVEMHGGTVSVESGGLGKGAEFTIRFPLERSSGVGPTAERPTGARRDGSARRVLVIEDNVDAAESLREVLELGEHAVEVAYAGAAGIDKARTFRPDVVLCDIGLPGMDGYQVARAIREDSELRKTALVALTGYAAPEDVAKSKEAGFDAHLAKPPKLEKLEELLGSLPTRARSSEGEAHHAT
ncbi:MAG: PAS domain S-box protein [Deltaproteobacteria bacterium]|nr:PAS domain S-box protein [Deltaproteobacteria bacterium]